MSRSLQPVLQATVGNGLSFDPFAFCQNGWTASTVDVCWGKIVDALVVAAVVIVVDKGGNLSFEITGQEIVFQQDAVFEGLVPALNLALGHWVIGCAVQVLDVAGTEPFGQIAGDVAGTIVGQEPWALHR